MSNTNIQEFISSAWESWLEDNQGIDPNAQKLCFIADLFDVVTYDQELAKELGEDIITSALVVSGEKQFSDLTPQQQRKHIICLNLPVFRAFIEWGTSIRGAWWQHGAQFFLEFNGDVFIGDRLEWIAFIKSLSEFVV